MPPTAQAIRLRQILLTIVPALLALAVVILALFGDNGLLRRHDLRRQLYQVTEEMKALKEENQRLRIEIERLQKSGVALEREAAERLLMASPGSTVYRFPKEDPQDPRPAEPMGTSP